MCGFAAMHSQPVLLQSTVPKSKSKHRNKMCGFAAVHSQPVQLQSTVPKSKSKHRNKMCGFAAVHSQPVQLQSTVPESKSKHRNKMCGFAAMHSQPAQQQRGGQVQAEHRGQLQSGQTGDEWWPAGSACARPAQGMVSWFASCSTVSCLVWCYCYGQLIRFLFHCFLSVVIVINVPESFSLGSNSVSLYLCVGVYVCVCVFGSAENWLTFYDCCCIYYYYYCY